MSSDTWAKIEPESLGPSLKKFRQAEAPADQRKELLARRPSWARKKANTFDPNTQNIVFQQIECDHVIVSEPYASPKAFEDGEPLSKIAVIRLFGCTEDGNSVLLNVYGFMPYCYVAVPAGASQIEDYALCKAMKTELNSELKQALESTPYSTECYVVSVDTIRRSDIMYYQGSEKRQFFKITFALPKHVATARKILEQGINVPYIGYHAFQTYESSIAFILRFMIDRDISGMSWIEATARKWIYSPSPVSSCQIEIDCYYKDLKSYPTDGEWMKVAPLRILSFDIESSSQKNNFPSPQQDPVIQIANIVTVYGRNEEIVRNVFVLGSCTPIVNVDVLCFESEADLLDAWRDFVLCCDPDILTGYNVVNFDIPYLFDRARQLRLELDRARQQKLAQFPYMSRIKESETKIVTKNFVSHAHGKKESKRVLMFGRVFFDAYQVIQRDYKLRSYTLNSVSDEFLGEQKEDVHYSIISKLYQGTADDRRRLAVYCVKDAYLPTRLLEKLMSLTNYIEMARVTGVPFSYLLIRGESIKVMAQLYRHARKEGVLIPYQGKDDSNKSYEGATVIRPQKGYHNVPIAILDFASLYPSIMIAHNICYSTLVKGSPGQVVPEEDVIVSPAGHSFVKYRVRKGILPQILEELITQRSAAKKEMATCSDAAKYAALNARQLALKLSANSVYGFTGALVGSLPCIEVSSSVTAFGREMIQFTVETINNEYRVENGYEHDCAIVYGDTDSVMVKFGTSDLNEAIQLGKRAAEFVTSKFPRPVSLEFEKVYYPYLLVSKKRYAGLLWTNAEKWERLDTKGLETVRRDNCLLVKHVVNVCLRNILIEQNIEKAINYCKEVLSDLLMNRLDISMLVITKALSKKDDEYKGKQAHVELKKKVEKREEKTYALGDRIPYIIKKGARKATISERAEDPIYVLKNNIPVDTQFYVDMLSRPLLRIFGPILENPQSVLLQGQHMLDITVPTPKTGGIVGFTKVHPSCQGCKALLGEDEKILCRYCQPQAPLFYNRLLELFRQNERNYSRVWTQCQRCQGSMHQEVLCTARDCPIFYLRTKLQMDLEANSKQLELYGIDW
ncbi:uncharacterized protein LOC126325829 [Schistocerca gregaria]|uniref:uncharacterized protein LOC126325829 n=1 Tax=Schistocerca gregaria TaxID=7010 RepID=UPI00211E61A7|nr:uncharacterized protein LOC126325829 [Schistocerca gregaria]